VRSDGTCTLLQSIIMLHANRSKKPFTVLKRDVTKKKKKKRNTSLDHRGTLQPFHMYRSISFASLLLSCFLSLPCKLHNFPKQETTLQSQTTCEATTHLCSVSHFCTVTIKLAGAVSGAVSSTTLLHLRVFYTNFFQVHPSALLL
jgi:hypothetical protein